MSRIVIALLLCLTVSEAAVPSLSYADEPGLESYYRKLNRRCRQDSDCEVKDARNCCGYYPLCLSRNAKVDPDYVARFCKEKSMMGICGFPSISGCRCEDGECRSNEADATLSPQ